MQVNLGTPLVTGLGASLPIFGFSHSVEVTVAITRAGGFAVLGVARDEPEEIHHLLSQVRDQVGDRPFGVDLMFPKLAGNDTTIDDARKRIPQEHQAFIQHLRTKYSVPAATTSNFFTSQIRSESFFREQTAAVLASDVDLVACAVGVPTEVIREIKQRGKTALALVGAVKHAQAALDAGVDVLVAQGSDAGGHTGPIGTFTLVPQIIAAAGKVPVIAAGGVGHGSQIAAALAMGAQGVWLGTAWLSTIEHKLHRTMLKQLLAAGSEDAVITRAHSGKSCRVLKGGWTQEWESDAAPKPLPMPYQQVLTGDLLAAAEEHHIESLVYTPAGQSVAWFNEVESVQTVMRRLTDETRDALLALQHLTRAK